MTRLRLALNPMSILGEHARLVIGERSQPRLDGMSDTRSNLCPNLC